MYIHTSSHVYYVFISFLSKIYWISMKFFTRLDLGQHRIFSYCPDCANPGENYKIRRGRSRECKLYKTCISRNRKSFLWQIYLIFRANPSTAQIIGFGDEQSVANSNFDFSKVTVFFAHGWNGNGGNTMNKLLTEGNLNILSIFCFFFFVDVEILNVCPPLRQTRTDLNHFGCRGLLLVRLLPAIPWHKLWYIN